MVCRSMVGGPIFLRLWMAIFGLVFALAGIAGSLYTDRLTLDLMTRTYTRRKGYLRKIQRRAAPSMTSRASHCRSSIDTSSHGQPIPYWALRLVLRNADSISIASFGSEQAAYARLDSIAKALHVPAIDRTGDQETTTQPDNLDQPLVMKSPHRVPQLTGTDFPPLPAGSRIRLTGAEPQRNIVLPPWGFSVGIALIFGWFALILFFMGFSGLHDKTGRTPPAHFLGIDRDYSSARDVLSLAHPSCVLQPSIGDGDGGKSLLRAAALRLALRLEANRKNCHRGNSRKTRDESRHLPADAAQSLQGRSSTRFRLSMKSAYAPERRWSGSAET